MAIPTRLSHTRYKLGLDQSGEIFYMGLLECEIRELTKVAYNLLESGKIAKAVEYFENAARKAKEAGIASAIVTSYVNAGACLVTQGEYHRGRSFLQSALKIVENIPKDSVQAECSGPKLELCGGSITSRLSGDIHHYLGQAYYKLGDSETAIIHLTNSFNLYVCEELSRLAAESLSLMSRCYRNIEDCEREILALKKLAELHHDMGDIAREADACILLARVYLRERRDSSAKQMLSNLRILCQRVEDSHTGCKLYCELGVLYGSIGSFDSAMECFERGLAMVQRMPHRSISLLSEASLLQNIGAVYNEKGMYSESLAYHQEAIAIHGQMMNHSSESKCLCNLATAQLHLGQPEEAAISYSNALATAYKCGKIYIQLQACEGLGSINIWWKKYGDAVGYFKQALVLLDNIKEDSGIARERVMEKLSKALELLEVDRSGEGQELFSTGKPEHKTEGASPVDRKMESRNSIKNTVTRSLSPEFAAAAEAQDDAPTTSKMLKNISLRERRGVQGTLAPINTNFKDSPTSSSPLVPPKNLSGGGHKGKGKLKRVASRESDGTLNEDLQAYMASYAHSSDEDEEQDTSSDNKATPQQYLGKGSLAIGPREQFKVTFVDEKSKKKGHRRKSKIVPISEPEPSEETQDETAAGRQQSRLCIIL